MYGPSQLGWNFLSARLAVFSKTLLKTNSPARNVRGFTRRLSKFSSLYWYDAICTAAASQSLLVVSRSLATTSAFSFLTIYVRTVGIPISTGMMASIPYVKANSDTPVGFQLVVL